MSSEHRRAFLEFLNATMLFLALLSEIAVELGLSHEITRLKNLWTHIARWPEARELVECRYARLLSIDWSGDHG